MNIDANIFKAYDIRGIYPSQINEQNIESLIKGIYTFFSRTLKKEKLTIVLGRDMRLSSPNISKKAQETLIAMGAQVIDIGLSTTPSVYFTVFHYNYDAGIQISASHNPSQYNGIKFFYKNGNQLIKVAKNTGMEDVKKICLENDFLNSQENGSLTQKNILEEEIEFALKTVSPIALKPFKVVADPANSVGALFLEKIFDKIPGSELVKINYELDGSFPAHEANPIKFDTLKELQEKVVSEKADFGIATDGDADRIFFIDEKGAIVPATLITALIAREILLKNKNEKILVDIRYLNNSRAVIEKYGGQMEVNVVGHSLITSHLNRVSGAFAGESSGHFFFRETGGAESSIRVIYHLLNVLSRENKPISEVLHTLSSSSESGEFNFKMNDGVASAVILDKITKNYPQGKVTLIDGLSIDFPDWRFNIRTSNTEPLLRLNLEAKDETLMKIKLKEVMDQIVNCGATIDRS